MKPIQTSIIAGLAFLLSAGISYGAELDDLDLTIRVVTSDDVSEMHNELSLPDMVSDSAREHTDNEEGHGLSQTNHARDRGHDESEDEQHHALENEVEHDLADEMEARDEREDAIEDADEMREDNDDRNDERGEADEVEHAEDHAMSDAQGDGDSGATNHD